LKIRLQRQVRKINRWRRTRWVDCKPHRDYNSSNYV